jgi:hypothetical protein
VADFTPVLLVDIGELAVMKGIKYTLMSSIVAFLMGASSSPFDTTGILRALNRIPALLADHRELIGRDNPARVLPQTASAASLAPAVAADRVTRSGDELFGGKLKEDAERDDVTNQGSGYGDVFDSDGHLLWRFAVLERGNSQWTILKYFSESTPELRNSKAGRTSQTQN